LMKPKDVIHCVACKHWLAEENCLAGVCKIFDTATGYEFHCDSPKAERREEKPS
jgi:hypothetical protein